MHRKKKAKVSDSFDDKSQIIHQLLYICHTTKVKFEQTILTIKKLKKEHTTFMNCVLSGVKQKSDREVVKMAIFKLCEAQDLVSFGDSDEDTLSFFEALFVISLLFCYNGEAEKTLILIPGIVILIPGIAILISNVVTFMTGAFILIPVLIL